MLIYLLGQFVCSFVCSVHLTNFSILSKFYTLITVLLSRYPFEGCI